MSIFQVLQLFNAKNIVLCLKSFLFKKSGTSCHVPGSLGPWCGIFEFACLRLLFRHGIAAEGLSALRSVRFSTSKGRIAISRGFTNPVDPPELPRACYIRASTMIAYSRINMQTTAKARIWKAPFPSSTSTSYSLVMQPSLSPPGGKSVEIPACARGTFTTKLIAVAAFGRNDNQIAPKLTGTRGGRTMRNVRGCPQTPE